CTPAPATGAATSRPRETPGGSEGRLSATARRGALPGRILAATLGSRARTEGWLRQGDPGWVTVCHGGGLRGGSGHRRAAGLGPPGFSVRLDARWRNDSG